MNGEDVIMQALRTALGGLVLTLLAGGAAAFAPPPAPGSAPIIRVDAESGLYDPAPPPGSAFVRVINATEAAELAATLDGAGWIKTDALGPSAYRPVPAGAHEAAIGGKSAALAIEAGQFYSVVADGDAAAPGLTVMPDPKLDSMAKALISLYNLTDRPALSLKTADGKVAVIESVAAEATGNRQVNPLKVQFAVFEGDHPIATIDEVAIERGAAYSVIVTDIGGKLQAQWVRSSTRSK